VIARAEQSLLPGAPPVGAERSPNGLFSIDLSVSRAFSLDTKVFTDVLDPDQCPASALPFLAWALSVDVWPGGSTDQDKRTILKAAVATHHIKGTSKSIKDALKAAGYGQITIREGVDAWQLDGSVKLDGTRQFSKEGGWASWEVDVENSDPVPSDDLITLLIQTAPGRCRLVSIGHAKVFSRLDGTWLLDGSRKLERIVTEV
jgi:hypothetical protein